MAIRFGTSGWRAIIADEFTFSHVRTVSQAICEHFSKEPSFASGSLVVGNDTRFLESGLPPSVPSRFPPMASAPCYARNLLQHPVFPMLSAVKRPPPVLTYGLAQSTGIQRMKLSTSDGAPALPAVTENDRATHLSTSKRARAADNSRRQVHLF